MRISGWSSDVCSSDLRGASWYVGRKTGRDVEFLDRGSLNAYGLGGSLMLDWEHYRPGYEVDVELRYSDIRLQSFDSSAAVKGEASARSAKIGRTSCRERVCRYV